MSEVLRDIVARLQEIQAHAYVPYSQHPVAALVESDDGQRLKTYSMDELLPDSFGPENIGKPSPMSSG